MSVRIANAQLRMLQNRELPGLTTDSIASRKKRKQPADRVSENKKRRKSTHKGRPTSSKASRQAPIARKVKEAKARASTIMQEFEDEKAYRKQDAKRTRRTLKALKVRKSAVAKNTLALLLVRK